MKLYAACALLLLSSYAFGQEHTFAPSRLSITASLAKTTYKVGEPIKVRLEVLNTLHDKVRIPRILITPLVDCVSSSDGKSNPPYKPFYQVGFDVALAKKEAPTFSCVPFFEDHTTIFSQGSLVDRSLMLLSDEFYGTEYVLAVPTEPGTYTLTGTYHGWDPAKVTKEDLASLKKEDSYVPIGDFELPGVTVTIK